MLLPKGTFYVRIIFVQTWSRGKNLGLPSKHSTDTSKKILDTLIEILLVGSNFLVSRLQLGPGITKSLATPLYVHIKTHSSLLCIQEKAGASHSVYIDRKWDFHIMVSSPKHTIFAL